MEARRLSHEPQHGQPGDLLADPRLISTFSIVAADVEAGEVGVAVQSRYLAVGAVVPWARAGVGAVATQATGFAGFGPQILEALARGETPAAALAAALITDPLRTRRQLGVVSAAGDSAGHTGDECMAWAGGLNGPGSPRKATSSPARPW